MTYDRDDSTEAPGQGEPMTSHYTQNAATFDQLTDQATAAELAHVQASLIGQIMAKTGPQDFAAMLDLAAWHAKIASPYPPKASR